MQTTHSTVKEPKVVKQTAHSTVKEPKVAKVKSIHYPDHISALETWEMECVVYHGELRELRLLDFGELKNLAGGEDALRDFKPTFGNGNF